jgi:hypothetical protein
MANGIESLLGVRPAAAETSAPPHVNDIAVTVDDPDTGVPRVVLVIPAVSLLMAGLVALALAAFVGTPSLSRTPATAATDEGLPVVDEIDAVGTLRLGPSLTR